MVNEFCKKKASSLVKKAKEKGQITNYKNFCKGLEARETALSKEEITYYISKHEEGKNEKI